MRNNPPKVTVSGRVSESQKRQLKESGMNVSHCVEYFLQQHRDPVKALECDIYFLKEEICNIKVDLIDKEMRLEELVNNLEEAKRDSVSVYPEVVLKDVASDFLRLYKCSDYYKDVSIHDALDLARKGLVNKVKNYGYTYDDLCNVVLKEHSKIISCGGD